MRPETPWPGLPEFCAAELPSTGETILIRRGERGYWASPDRDVERTNRSLGVTPAQREAMLVGSMFGWEVPGADPRRYDENGNPRDAARKQEG